MGWDESHVASGDLDEGLHVVVAAYSRRGPRCVLPDGEPQDHQEGGHGVFGRGEGVHNRLSHVIRVVFRVGSARARQAVAEGVVECPKGRVFRVCCTVGDVLFHEAVEWAGEDFRPSVERELDGPLQCRGRSPLVSRFVFPTLRVERFRSQVVAKHQAL